MSDTQPQPEFPRYAEGVAAEDSHELEIDLRDLFLMLWRRKIIILTFG